VKGSKPRTPLRVIADTGRKRSGYPCPAWLPPEANAEWQRVVEDLSSRGALASLEHYVLCIAQIRQCQRILAGAPRSPTPRAFTRLTRPSRRRSRAPAYSPSNPA
jgi:hypothetical protein